MNKIISSLSILSAGLCLAIPAHALNLFIGANGGFAQLGTPRDSGEGLNAPENRYVPSWSVYVGQQWPINQAKDISLGWELKYNDYGATQYQGDNSTLFSNGTLKFFTQSIDLLALIGKTWQSGWNVFGEAGVSYQMQKSELSSPMVINGLYMTDTGAHTASGFEPTVAVGLGYMPTTNMNIYLAANYTWGDTQHNWDFVHRQSDYQQIYAVSSLRLGLSYFF